MSNKKILVAGLGSTGESVLAYYQHKGLMHVAGYDGALSAEKKQYYQNRFPNYAFFSGRLAEVLFHYDVLVLSPGISRKLPEIVAFEARGGVVMGDIAILAEQLHTQTDKIIAITGSNGKTTTTSLVGYLCKQCGLDTVVAGNIGTPVLKAWLDRQGKAADVWVLELSSFQLETTQYLGATVAACLNISEDHLDRYDDLLDYARAKDLIFNGCQTQILNADDPLCRAMKRPQQQTLFFSRQQVQDFWFDHDSQTLKQGTQILMEAQTIPLQGSHNYANILVALALCESIGLPRKALLNHIQTFKGLPHRVEKIGEKNGITFINDSKGTNVGATIAALNGLSGTIHLIAGGVGKGQDFSPLATFINDKVRTVYLIGQDAPKIAQAIQHCQRPIIFCASLNDAVQQAYTQAQPGEIVLLSPACASFDMFNDYAHRAQVFIQAFDTLGT